MSSPLHFAFFQSTNPSGNSLRQTMPGYCGNVKECAQKSGFVLSMILEEDWDDSVLWVKGSGADSAL